MKRYIFSLTKKEMLEFCVRAVGEHYRRRWGVLVLWGFLFVMETLLYRPAGCFILLLFLSLMGFEVLRSYFSLEKGDFAKERTIWLEDGKIKCSTGRLGEVDCADFGVIRQSRRLLMLGHWQSKKRVTWHVIPLRVFADRQEAEEFLAEFRRQACREVDRGRETEEQDGNGFAFSFVMEEAMWIQICRAAAEAVSAGTLGQGRNRKVVGLYAGMLGLILLFSWRFLRMEPAYLILCALLFALFLGYAGMTDPEARIRRRVRTGRIQNDVYGLWRVALSEDGVCQDQQGKQRIFIPWKEFGWLVETEGCFFLFLKENSQFIPVPKRAMESAAQAAEAAALCARKGLIVTCGKRRKYWPEWLFGLLFAGIVLGFFAYSALRALWDAEDARGKSFDPASYSAEEAFDSGDYSARGAFDPADYPDYVPLDRQAEILRSLGLTVEQETVESVRSWMEEYGMQAYVEGSPFFSLLTEMGMPVYNESWEITEYPGEVFWFDFEGWDPAQDYITVLSGMQKLADGSVLGEVTEIAEDISEVDWEAGSGTVRVMFRFRGQEYSWNMKMMYDWIDPKVLGIFNSLLQETGEEKRFYAAEDGGQGALVFFADSEWAEKFEDATGIELECSVNGQAKAILF